MSGPAASACGTMSRISKFTLLTRCALPTNFWWRSSAFAFLGLHHRHLIHLPGFVISGPLTNLLAVQEVPRTHPCSVFPEPLPITGGDPIGHFPFRPDGAVFVVLNVFLLPCFLGGH